MNTTNRKRDASGPGANHDPVADEILKAIRRILRTTAEHSRQLARHAGLTVAQVLCMRVIEGAPRGQEATVVQVAKTVQLSPATVSRLLDRLEQAGLVVRKRVSSDRRRVCLSLTPAGRRQIRKVPAPLHEQFLQRLKKMPKREQLALLKCLEEIVAMMGAADLEAAPLLTPGVDVKPPAESSRRGKSTR